MCAAVDRLRPCTAAEALAYKYLSKTQGRPAAGFAPPGDRQQGFVDERSVVRVEQPAEDAQGQVPEDDQHEWGWIDETMPEREARPASSGGTVGAEPTARPLPAAGPAQTSRQLDALEDVPRSVRRRLEVPPEEPLPRRVDEDMLGPTALLDAWKRTGTSGPGVDILESRSSYLVFVAERRYKKNKNPKTIV